MSNGVQVIDDTLGHTLVGMSTLTPLIREELKEQGINAANVVRLPCKFHAVHAFYVHLCAISQRASAHGAETRSHGHAQARTDVCL